MKNKTTMDTSVSVHESLISFHFIIFSAMIRSNGNLLLGVVIGNLRRALIPFEPADIPNTRRRR